MKKKTGGELGEHVGADGYVLATYRITCPFCLQDGNFGTAHHMEKEDQPERY